MKIELYIRSSEPIKPYIKLSDESCDWFDPLKHYLELILVCFTANCFFPIGFLYFSWLVLPRRIIRVSSECLYYHRKRKTGNNIINN